MLNYIPLITQLTGLVVLFKAKIRRVLFTLNKLQQFSELNYQPRVTLGHAHLTTFKMALYVVVFKLMNTAVIGSQCCLFS